MSDSINWQQCLELANQNTEMASDLLKMFIADLPDITRSIHQQFAAQDYAALEATTHRLHGASCYCGVPYLKDAAKQLEIRLRSLDKFPIENNEIEDLVEILLDEINAVEISYQHHQPA